MIRNKWPVFFVLILTLTPFLLGDSAAAEKTRYPNKMTYKVKQDSGNIFIEVYHLSKARKEYDLIATGRVEPYDLCTISLFYDPYLIRPGGHDAILVGSFHFEDDRVTVKSLRDWIENKRWIVYGEEGRKFGTGTFMFHCRGLIESWEVLN